MNTMSCTILRGCVDKRPTKTYLIDTIYIKLLTLHECVIYIMVLFYRQSVVTLRSTGSWMPYTNIVRCVGLPRLAGAPAVWARAIATPRPRAAPARPPGSDATPCSCAASDKLRLHFVVDFLFALTRLYTQMESQRLINFTSKHIFSLLIRMILLIWMLCKYFLFHFRSPILCSVIL